MPNHYGGDLLHTMGMSGLSLRTELLHFVVVPAAPPHPVQLNCQLPGHRDFGDLAPASHGQVEKLAAPLRIAAGLMDTNPAARLGRFTRTAKTADTRGTALTAGEAQTFLAAANDVCEEYYPLFLTALRAGLRRGELVALQWGDLQFGRNDDDANRFIVVQHNYVCREHTTTKSKKSRRVDLSRELRRVLIDLREKRLLEAFLKRKNDISGELVFRSPEKSILDPDNLYHPYFLPVLAKAGIRKIRLHDLRHTFGSLLIQNGASIVYVKDQMGHSSIQVTVSTPTGT